MKRNLNENFIDYCRRLTEAATNKEISYGEWAKGLADDNIYNDESLRRACVIFNLFLQKLSKEEIENVTDEQVLDRIQLQKEELIKERKKLQSENIFYQENLRSIARNELFNEKIVEAIKKLEPIKQNFQTLTSWTTKDEENSVGMVIVADAHYGSEIELKSLFNEVVNVYNPFVFKARMNLLARNIVNDYDRFCYKRLIVCDLGDCVENILRISSLRKVHNSVIDSVIEYAEFMSQWLLDLQQSLDIPIQYELCGGNHDICRMLTSKPDFPEENLAKIVAEFVKLRLKDISAIEVKDYSEYQFENIFGENIMMYHGDNSKSEKEEMSFWENYHDIRIDLLILAHKHSKNEQGIGYGCFGDKEVIHVPSLVGADQFSKKIRRISRAGAKFILLEEDKGKTFEKTYYLN